MIPQMQAWYVRHFGAKPGMRNEALVADLPGTQLRFAKTATPTVTTKGRVLDHIGFDVKDLRSFLKKLEAAGVKIDRPFTPSPLRRRAGLHLRPVGHLYRAQRAAQPAVGGRPAARMSLG